MLFNSINFLVFFPIVVLIYFMIPRKLRYIWLLTASYYFYMSWNPKYAILIAVSTAITYGTGRFIGYSKKEQIKKMWIFICLASNIGILGLFKYANFLLTNFFALAQRFGLRCIEYRLDLLLPVGISFYTFQAISYTIDVYRGEVSAEKNILKYALFVSFFPQLVAGPIERSGNLMTQIRNIESIELKNLQNIKEGFMLMLWGFFQKLVIADRISIFVNAIYNDYHKYGFMEIGLATTLFAFQIYCDFGGYSDIARGAARIMGFTLMHNFRQPYLATSIRDFWSRWHISLTSWFTDYLYIPLGGNRRGKGRQVLNNFIVFLVSGFWHGAQWNYVMWGFLHAAFQTFGRIKKALFVKWGIFQTKATFSTRIRKIISTFILVDFAWIFFAGNGLQNALKLLRQMTKAFMIYGITDLNFGVFDWTALILGIFILSVVDVLHEKGISINRFFEKQENWFRGGGNGSTSLVYYPARRIW